MRIILSLDNRIFNTSYKYVCLKSFAKLKTESKTTTKEKDPIKRDRVDLKKHRTSRNICMNIHIYVICLYICRVCMPVRTDVRVRIRVGIRVTITNSITEERIHN